VLGHEFCGEGAAAQGGRGAELLGKRVMVEPDIYCGRCAYCRAGVTNMCPDAVVLFDHVPGAFAQYLIVPAQALEQGQVHVLPETLSDDAAVLIEPLACVLHGQARALRQVLLRRSALIFGAGVIGILHALAARLEGFERVVLVDVPQRLQFLERSLPLRAELQLAEAGAGDDQLLALSAAGGYDLAVQACADIPVLERCLRLLAPAGAAIAFADVGAGQPASFDAHALHTRDVSLCGSCNYLPCDVRRALELGAGGRGPGDALISHRIGLGQLQEALLRAQQGRCLKVVVKPNLPAPVRRSFVSRDFL